MLDRALGRRVSAAECSKVADVCLGAPGITFAGVHEGWLPVAVGRSRGDAIFEVLLAASL